MNYCKMIAKRHNAQRCSCEEKAEKYQEAWTDLERSKITHMRATLRKKYALSSWLEFNQ